ncbi:uncharacterized protein CBL_13849 [Carabus blaptoides fortunei]
MESHIGNIMTLSNSIIGVSILAMPFCFKQCGIILAIVMLIASSIITRLTSHFLLKSAIMARRRTFELLAFHAFGTTGKFIVEVGIIGFLLGTCIAFFVIIGDLGPAIIAKILGTKPTDTLRTCILIGVALFFVLPLGLLKNVDSLHNVCTATIGFYFCLALKTISESTEHFATGDWLSKVELWRPIGILQCLPIFAMALACQTQLFEIYEIVANPTLDKMNYIVRIAVNICVAVYVCVGFFGYVAFASHQFTGNILMSFSPSLITDVMKIGFVFSVAFSFPLVIFPCRASLNSLLFKKGYTPYEGASNHIPGLRFKSLTALIVVTSLIIGILIPNIEVVLGLVGSTIGTMICLIFPVTCFICISTKNTNERLLAQILLFIGVIVMVMGTYANMYAMEEINTTIVTEKSQVIGNQMVDFENNIMKAVQGENVAKTVLDKKEIKNEQIMKSVNEEPPIAIKELPEEIRLEPPQPVEPQDDNERKAKLPVIKPIESKPELVEQKTENIVELPNKLVVVNQEQIMKERSIDKVENVMENVLKNKEISVETKKGDEVDIEAIKKEDKELQEEEKNKNTEEENEKAELFKKIEKYKEEQKSLLEEQKEILQEIKKEKQELEEQKIENDIDETRKKATNKIIQIAKKAIERMPEKEKTVLKKEKLDTKKINKFNDMIINDPVARQLLKMSNNSINKTKTEHLRDRLRPLPMAQNKSFTEMLYQSKKVNENNVVINSSLQETKVAASMNNEVDTGSIRRNIKLDNVKPIKGQELIREKVLKDIKSNDNNDHENIETEKQKNNIPEVVTENKPENDISNENVIPAKRDILENIENTENVVRVKRESENDSTVLKHNDKCELEDKKEFAKTESPMMRLITEIIKTDVLQMNTNNVIEGLKNQLKADSMHLKRK